MTAYRVGLVGLGKIARDRHVPAIAADSGFELVGVADPHGVALAGVAMYRDHAALIAEAAVDVVAICTPPQARFEIARAALAAGKHVLLEKPPTMAVGELAYLQDLAAAEGRVLFTAWHSQHNAAVAQARQVLRDRLVTGLRIDWKEDVQKYHPGQSWIWEPGGFGVFDAGVNGLSILTRLFGSALFVRGATLVFPRGCQTPIAASLVFSMRAAAGPMQGAFDWRGGGVEQRSVHIDTAGGGHVALSASGGRLVVDGVELLAGPRSEYPMLYRHFSDLLQSGKSDVDGGPLRMVADAFLLGRRIEVAEIAD